WQKKIGWTHEHNKRKRSCTPLKSYHDLSQTEVDRVHSALEAASNLGESNKKKVPTREGLQTRKVSSAIKKEDPTAKKEVEKSAESIKLTKKKVGIQERPETKKNSSCDEVDPSEEEYDEDSEPGTSQKNKSECSSLTVDKRTKRRMQTALKLLDFVEGKYDGSESDWSVDTSQSSECSESASDGGKNSTRRLQAMRDLSSREYFGYCRDCRSRCRSCGRRPSAVAIPKSSKR
ncbi:uncharacterized protein, partial [Drosophila takahashii]|uniref:uncharacterized protein n=1 Tax=Drosophila takahashii TaxID=29030 RepID=UPI0038995577